MRVRFVEEYDPRKQKTWWFVEKREFGCWWYVLGTLASSEGEGREYWECVKTHGIGTSKKVLDTATI